MNARKLLWPGVARFLVLLLVSFGLMAFVWYVAEKEQAPSTYDAEKVNLALRRTADALLKIAGDSTSRIPPVEQTAERLWLLRLERSFQYDYLPELLQTSLDAYGITEHYEVAVLRCMDGALLLGYSWMDYAQRDEVPCGGRELPQDCYNLQVRFDSGPTKSGHFPVLGWVFSGMAALGMFFIGKKWARLVPSKSESAPEVEGLVFGHSRLDMSNQTLICGEKRHTLTYREAKLLHLFAQHPNQVLERSFILNQVWADEGILVGRSVDMFVSRLRKMLRDDATVSLVAVHGVGYRMEVA